MGERFTVVGIGEALFDIFPESERLGGAPLNMALCAHQLAQVRGGRGVLASRIGQDELGQRLRDELTARGLTTDYIQTDPDRSTGKVYVDFDIEGNPTYEIVQHVAWDVIQYDPDIEDLAQGCQAVCFGTLAQRNAQTRHTIYRFLDHTRRAPILFDVNLRGETYDHSMIRRSCEQATIVKLNDQELPVIANLLGIVVEEEASSEGHVEGRTAGQSERKITLQIKAIINRFNLEALVARRAVPTARSCTPRRTCTKASLRTISPPPTPTRWARAMRVPRRSSWRVCFACPRKRSSTSPTTAAHTSPPSRARHPSCPRRS